MDRKLGIAMPRIHSSCYHLQMLTIPKICAAFHEAGHITIAFVLNIPIESVGFDGGRPFTKLSRNLTELSLPLGDKCKFLAGGAAGESFHTNRLDLQYSARDQEYISLLGGGPIKNFIPGAVELIERNQGMFKTLVDTLRNALEEASPFDEVLLTNYELEAILHPSC